MKVYYILYKCNISYNMKIYEDITHLKQQASLDVYNYYMYILYILTLAN